MLPTLGVVYQQIVVLCPSYPTCNAGYLGASDILVIWDGKMNSGQYRGERGYVVLVSPNEDNYGDFVKGG